MSQALNPITFPLHGQRLIEASAGTGKTYTITGLYLRLLLGHGDEISRFVKPLSVDQILVVTFTEAATQELKDRIRLRIKDARHAFSEYLVSQTLPSDPFLCALIEDALNPESRLNIKDAISTLNYAERQMDEAAIFTINGFCMRMLQQHAFESGSLFTIKLCEEDSELKFNAVKDFWRQQFYPLPKYLVEIILSCWKNPEALLGDIGFLLSDKPIQFLKDLSIDDIETLHKRNQAQVDELKSQLKPEFDAFIAELIKANTDKQFNGGPYRANWVANWVTQVSGWLNSDNVYQVPECLYRFGSTFIQEKTKDGQVIELRWPIAEAIQTFVEHLPQIKPALKRHAIRICRSLYQRHKRKQGVITFDDQISTLANALNTPETGIALAHKLREQFPVAMVDEFQDTDESQYQVFSQVYREVDTNTSDPEASITGLFMIGDPKQAIYGFRGGDIFTYMKARTQAADHYNLDTNWRSSSSMVNAVNTLFDQADSAFIYDDQIPFESVLANVSADSMAWTVAGEEQPAMILWQPDTEEPYSRDTDYRADLTESTANEIARLLSLSEEQGVWLHKGADKKPLTPSNIAILVRSASQAQSVRAALADRGVASVYSSERSSVFEQSEALAVLRILKAALNSENESLIKAAVGSELFGWSAEKLNQLNEDEQVWETLIFEFRAFLKTWTYQGVLPALHQLMFNHELAQTLRTQTNGERKLTDFLHLCELLQSESKSVESQYGLVAWLEERIQNPNQNAKEQQLRLESEQDLVQVVTYHKSKGLEYDIVFAPFVSYPFNAPSKAITTIHNAQGDALIDVENQEQQLADQERLAEDVRLLYVTLTRSVYACYLGLPGVTPKKPTKSSPDSTKLCPAQFHTTGLGWLCTQGSVFTPSEFGNLLNQWQSSNSDIRIQGLQQGRYDYTAQVKQSGHLVARVFDGQIDQNWWVTSYSRLVSEGHHSHYEPQLYISEEDIQAVQSGNYDASVEESASEDEVHSSTISDLQSNQLTVTNAKDSVSIHTFPKGADPGTFLHTLFEEIEYQDCQSDEVREQIKGLLEKSTLAHQVIDQILPFYTLLGLSEEEKNTRESDALEHWVDVLHELVINVLSKPLIADQYKESLDLSSIPVLQNTLPSQRLVELEFLIPMAEISAKEINEVITQDPLSARADHVLSFQRVQGMLKGFIDLTFEYQGKFYVLDWKSNYLGEDASAYTKEAMEEAMIDHRYDFQYQLYTLALHRYLRGRLPNYNYDQHIGGAFYIFLRGIEENDLSANPESLMTDAIPQNGVFFTKPEKILIEQLDHLFTGNNSTEQHCDNATSESSDPIQAEASVADIQALDTHAPKTHAPETQGPETLVTTVGDQGELF